MVFKRSLTTLTAAKTRPTALMRSLATRPAAPTRPPGKLRSKTYLGDDEQNNTAKQREACRNNDLK
jgi:hypothetical protein